MSADAITQDLPLPPTGKVTAGVVRVALRERYALPAWVLIEEVPDATGGQKSRTADAIAMGCWPSRGLELHGFEVKVSRADWLGELKKPEKAESIARFCDRWWLVIGDKKIVQPGELPGGWGLLVLEGQRLRCAVEAPALQPEAVSRGFIAALLRKMSNDVAKASKAELDKRFQEGFESGERWSKSRIEGLQKERDRLQRCITTFEGASGVRLDGYSDGTELGEAVRLIRTRGLAGFGQTLRRLHEQVQRVSSNLADGIAVIAPYENKPAEDIGLDEE